VASGPRCRRGNALRDDWAWLIVSMNGAEMAHAALYTPTK
jgi:hypothetical protein